MHCPAIFASIKEVLNFDNKEFFCSSSSSQALLVSKAWPHRENENRNSEGSNLDVIILILLHERAQALSF